MTGVVNADENIVASLGKAFEPNPMSFRGTEEGRILQRPLQHPAGK